MVLTWNAAEGAEVPTPTLLLVVSILNVLALTLKAVVEEENVNPADPERDVRFNAPVVKVNPLEAVKVEAKLPVDEKVAAPVVVSIPPTVVLPVEATVKLEVAPVPTENNWVGDDVPIPTLP